MAKRVDPDAARKVMLAAGVTPQVQYPGVGPWHCLCQKCGSDVFPRYYTVKKGLGACSECAKAVKLQKNAERGLKATEARLTKYGFEAIEPIRNARTSTKVRCKVCGEVSSRYLGGIDKVCPCSREQKKAPDAESFQARYPELAKFWDRSKNSVLPNDVYAGTHKRYWFRCAAGHSFQQQLFSHVRLKGSCPICAGRRILPGVNDLVTFAPAVAAEWHPTKNSKSPEQLSPGFNGKVWWLGKCGHEWEASPNRRVHSGQGCPVCANLKLVVGVNDLETTHPNIARQWDPIKNKKGPSEVVWGTHQQVWWLCDLGHSWRTAVITRQKSGCPVCTGRVLLKGFNDLASQAPDIAREWSTKNRKLPDEVLKGTASLAWWRCGTCNAEWRAGVVNRTANGSGCPRCAKPGYDATSDGYLYLLRKENLGLQQFGITNVPRSRLKTHSGNGWEVLDVIGPADGYWIRDTETALSRFFKSKGLLLSSNYTDKFDGYSESWEAQELSFDTVAEMLEALRSWEQ